MTMFRRRNQTKIIALVEKRKTSVIITCNMKLKKTRQYCNMSFNSKMKVSNFKVGAMVKEE